MIENIKTYILVSEYEFDRLPFIQKLKEQFNQLVLIDAVFPKYQKVPFLEKLIEISKSRTGKQLNQNEIGCLLGHRKIWKIISKFKETNTHFLILESDSKILNYEIINKYFTIVQDNFDIFFWGSWNGHSSIKKSTKKIIDNKWIYGPPLVKSIYGTYGYSLNAKTAKYLLQATKKISYPVDMFKFNINENEIKIGAIRPEIITTWRITPSNIKKENFLVNLKHNLIIKIFDVRNRIQSYFY
jgi:GR25 family glycosyltransferase involved in LPS biosynthesis